MTPAEIYVAARCRGLAPPRERLVSEWAAAKRILPPTSAMPGRWRNEVTPYLTEVMDALSSEDPAETVVFMKSAQIGATEAGLCFLGYMIENAPGLCLYVMPTTESARRTVRTRIDPLFEATPSLAARVVKQRSRDPGNTATLKSFPGGQIAFVGANSAVGLRSIPARYLFLDEVDGFGLGRQLHAPDHRTPSLCVNPGAPAKSPAHSRQV